MLFAKKKIIFDFNQKIHTFKNYFLFQILSRLNKSEHSANRGVAVPTRNREPNFEELMLKRDYIGARTLLEVKKIKSQLFNL